MISSFHLNRLFWILAGVGAFIYALSFFIPLFYDIGTAVFVLLLVAVIIDILLLYGNKTGFAAERILPERFSNGDVNQVQLLLHNRYGFPAQVNIIEELPYQFQARDWSRELSISGNSNTELAYELVPLTRGEYIFNNINVYVKSPAGLVSRRYIFPYSQVVKVYPSYQQMRRYQLLAINNKLQEAGVKKVRRLGHSLEFEQVKEYVPGDDYRTVNWKATARKADLMVNSFTDERSQQIYCIINKGRVMKMPFKGMYLLDYAINAALVLSNVALAKQDKAGLITLSENLDTFLVADKKPTQINLILESLYKQDTHFLEPDLEKLFSAIRSRIAHRSLLVYFTNFESIESLERQLPSLKKIAKYHLLLVVLFENTELKTLQESSVKKLEDIYIKTIADKFSNEKKLMVKELQKNGIAAVLTTPENLTVNTINKYLELKTRLSI